MNVNNKYVICKVQLNLRGDSILIFGCNIGVEMLARLKFGRKYVSALFTTLGHLKFGGKFVALLSFENMCHSWQVCEPPTESPLARHGSPSEIQRILRTIRNITPDPEIDSKLAKFAINEIKLCFWQCFTVGSESDAFVPNLVIRWCHLH